MAIKAILLDLDGTVLNTLDDLADSVNYALSSLGFPIRSRDDIRRICGNGPHNLIQKSLPENADNDAFEKCLVNFKKHYEINKTNKTAPYDGILPALAKLKELGFKLAIVSNKHDDALRDLCDKYFAEYIDFSIGSSDLLPKKPAPDMVYYALDKLGVDRKSAVYVGDSEVDILTAKNAGLPCISVVWGFRDEDVLIKSGASNIIYSPDKLIEAIKSF